MSWDNGTSFSRFILLGFSDLPELQPFISLGLFLLYLITVSGNLLIITAVCLSSRLHKPMYFFLCNLSFLDLCCTSITIPKMIACLLTGNNVITFTECVTQLYFFLSFTSTEFFLLSAMSYDRYVAICNPLRYALIMNKRICILLAAASWITGFLDIVPYMVFISRLVFCHDNIINHFFCDIPPLMELACNGIQSFQLTIFVEGIFMGFIPFMMTLSSYTYIIAAILKIRSSQGRHKAFSTCSSHLTVVILFYGTVICMYMRPSSLQSPDQDKFFSLLYMAVIPMLNPIIYSLRNTDVKSALKKLFDVCPKHVTFSKTINEARSNLPN
ncbi:olfactory receptor 1019-like [Microcaecilia unicolor]|uniref:Olfactory receptor n=1 Tax=Microcaecilia unicolor TaxID=1415580 RepID=A0A6P7WMQ9_9AMPH|nr:olfactory receptor 1019-like [Microcaecilia unicolor]